MNKDGKYYNGLSPVSRFVSCIVTADGLEIYDYSTTALIVVWKKQNIFHDYNHSTAFIIGNVVDRSKIELLNLGIAKELGIEKYLQMTVTQNYKVLYKWFGAVLLAGLAFWFLIPVVSRKMAKKIPYDYEVKASTQMGISKYFKICSMTSKQAAALNLYSNFLYPKNDIEKKMPIILKVADSSMINAFTLPGGQIVLMKGLLNEVKTPEELLGVLGHEIGHVVNRDTAVFLIKGSMLGTFVSFFTGDFHSSFAISPQLFLSTAALTFDRDMEKEADRFAVKRLNLVDISTSGIRSFFSRRNSEENYGAPEMFANHPDYKSRINLIEETYPKESLPDEIQKAWPVIKAICGS